MNFKNVVINYTILQLYSSSVLSVSWFHTITIEMPSGYQLFISGLAGVGHHRGRRWPFVGVKNGAGSLLSSLLHR